LLATFFSPGGLQTGVACQSLCHGLGPIL